jgi:50S ribosomal protein L16 3-hydroxylase
MIQFNEITDDTFLSEYWQKKPCLIKKAFNEFEAPLSPDELAGLSLEEDVESRLVIHHPNQVPSYTLQNGPFTEETFQALPELNWTLLVQGLDRLIPEIQTILSHFNFIPRWRLDDVMVSYATIGGGVGPHFDHYDVFLYQAQGARKWSLSTKHCDENNYLEDADLRIMKTFEVEQEYTLEEGDMLYLPPHVAHDGVALNDDCMTYSFGYRRYQGSELLDNFCEYLQESNISSPLYDDPNWCEVKQTAAIPQSAVINAKKLLVKMLDDEAELSKCFGRFVTQCDRQAELLLPEPLSNDEMTSHKDLLVELKDHASLYHHPACKMAYYPHKENSPCLLFINGVQWQTIGACDALIKLIADNPQLDNKELLPFLEKEENRRFVHELFQLQWLSVKI